MKTIVILLDSLNRHMLRLYGNSWVKTPNMDRLASRSVVFDNHWVGSTPCMPARRDMMTGRLNFLERNWGPIEPFDITLPAVLKEHGVFSHIVTDHIHYLGIGGEGYLQQFNTWELHRGQIGDPWVSKVRPPERPQNYKGLFSPQYALNRTRFKTEAEYSGPKTFQSACDWLDDNHDGDPFLLWVEAFDPHEPFDCPQEYVDMYDPEYDGPDFYWRLGKVKDSDREMEHLRSRYAGLLTMTDKWLGKLLDKLDEHGLWEDTLIVCTTDHGHLLGEHGFIGKNIMHMYNELMHIPLIVHLPGGERAGTRVNALTQNIDLMPTVLEYYGQDIPASVRGKSWKGLLEGRTTRLRDAVLYGQHGATVNITDGHYTYFRSFAREDNQPCYLYTSMPVTSRRYLGKKTTASIETGRFLKHTDYPVYRFPVAPPRSEAPANAIAKEQGNEIYYKDTLLFDIRNDYGQHYPVEDPEIERKYIQLLMDGIREADAPDEQFVRLGLHSDIGGFGYGTT
jgi:arylsulfatase A-like enzyme